LTAIFVVMNETGLAIAADSAESAQMPNEKGEQVTVFTEKVSKIYRQEDYNFVVAHAGDSTINRVPIDGILNRWMSNCEKQDSLLDYAESFIKWLAEKSYLENMLANKDVTGELVRNQFWAISNSLIEDNETSFRDTVDSIYGQWELSDPHNIYGFSPKKTEDPLQDNAPQLYSRFCSRFVDYRLNDDIYRTFLDELTETVDAVFEQVFEEDQSIQIEDAEYLKQRAIKFNIDHNDSDKSSASLMFAGYGEKDWLPFVVVLNIYDFDMLLPRVSVRRVATPESKWYMSLAARAAVDKFFRPVDYYLETELRSKLHEKFKNRNYLKTVLETFDEVFSKHQDDTVDPIRRKINILSLDKLAFIAKQMVAMESFNSFVFQYLPEVGGEIDVVKISRSGLRDEGSPT
jgi:hypothetical protein